MPKDGQISADGLKFRRPIAELEAVLQEKIQRAREAGDKEALDLYRKVLDLAREKVESLGLGPGEDSPGGA